MTSHFELRTTVDGWPVALRFASEYALADFLETLDEDTEVHVVKVTRCKVTDVTLVDDNIGG